MFEPFRARVLHMRSAGSGSLHANSPLGEKCGRSGTELHDRAWELPREGRTTAFHVNSASTRLCATSADTSALPLRLVAGSSLPPVVFPVFEWRVALPAIRDPAITRTPRTGTAPFGSAPSVGSRPTHVDGRTRGATTEGIATPSIPAAQGANRTWVGNRDLRTRRAGFGPGSGGRSAPDPGGRCYVPNAGLSGEQISR